MTRQEEGRPSAIYLLLTVVVLVVALVVGLKLAVDRRGPSDRTETIIAARPGPEAAPRGAPPARPPEPMAATPELVAATPVPPPPVLPGPPPGDHPAIYGLISNDRGQTLAQARVALWLPATGPGRPMRSIAETRTSGDGQYLLAVPGAGSYTVVADAFGFVPAAEARVVLAAASETRQLNFTLSAGSVIAGRVQGPGNEPVEGAVITACDSPSIAIRKRVARLTTVPRAFEPHLRIPTLDHQMLDVAATLDESPYRAVSDAGGAFQIFGLPEGNYTLKAAHTGYAPAFQVAVAAGRRDLLFQLSQGGSISGTVSNRSGQAVVGAPMTLLYKLWMPAGVVRGQESFRLGHSETLRAVSGSGGRYIFDRLPEGEYDLAVKAEGYQSSTQAVDLARDESRKDVDFVLEVESVVAGKLSDSDGKLLSGGTVTATRVDENQSGAVVGFGGAEQRCESDEAGNYRLDDLAPGVYWIAASLPGYQCQDRRQLTVEAGGTITGIDFVLTRRAGLSGVVVDAAGRPIAGAVVRMGPKELEATMERALEILADQGQIEDMETKADAEGRFTLGNLKNRSYSIEVSAPGFASENLSLPAGMQDARIVLKKLEP